MNREKKPLYRKVNTKARGVSHNFGGDYKHSRNTKKETLEQVRGSMHGKSERGLDYTPLFKFLVSKVGQKWDDIHKEAITRLDKEEPIYWIVSLNPVDRKDRVRVGENSYFSGLFVDDSGILQKTNDSLEARDMTPFCDCCTHTFNGKVFGKG